MVRYIGAIDRSKVPLDVDGKAIFGWPNQEVVCIGIYRVQDAGALKEIINGELGSILRNGGMIVETSTEILDPQAVNIKNRIFVPMHMLTFIRTEVKSISGQVPILTDGKLETEDGKAIVLQ